MQKLFNFAAPPDSSLLYVGHYDPLLVCLSVAIAVLASYSALMVSRDLAIRRSVVVVRYGWTAVGGLCMGAGIWAMHFTGMLAFSLPCATDYDLTVTTLSMIPGLLASILALATIGRNEVSPARIVVGGLLLGVGIGAMHYSGMAAYRFQGMIRYDPGLVFASVVIAVVLAIFALWVKFQLRSWLGRWSALAPAAAAIVLGLAVSAMHYTAMASAYFIREGDAPLPGWQLAPTILAAIILIATTSIVVITLAAAFLAKSSPRRPPHTAQVVTGGLFVIGVIVLLTGWGILQTRADAHRSAEIATANLSKTLADDFNSTIQQVDLGLLAIRDEIYRQRKSGTWDDDDINAAVARQDQRQPDLLGFRIYGADGNLRSGIHNIVNSLANISSREEFAALRDTPNVGLVVGAPKLGFATRQWRIAVLRRIDNLDGSFGGVVLASIATDALERDYAKLDLGPGGAVGLVHTSFQLAARFPPQSRPDDPAFAVKISDQLRTVVAAGAP